MNCQNVVKNFAKRTKYNLKLIEENKSRGVEAYEVTQLINSCLGLLVLPQQHYMDSIPETPIDDMKKYGWVIPRVTGNFPQVENLNQLIRCLRNSVAHFNISFISDSENEIDTLKVWIVNRGKKTWEAILGLQELKSILEKFSDMLADYK